MAVERVVELGVGDDERRQELDDPARRSAAQQQQAALPEPVDQPARAASASGSSRPQRAPRPRSAKRRGRPERAARIERRGDASADRDGARREALFREDVEGGERRGAGERMGDEGAGVERLAAGAPGVHQRRPGRRPRRSAGRRRAPCRSRADRGGPLRASQAKSRPVRPKPVRISSRISAAPASRQSRESPASQPAGGTRTPSRPTTGSTSTAAGAGAAAARAPATARRSATRSSAQANGSRSTCDESWSSERRAELAPRGGRERAEGEAVVAGVEGEEARPAGREQRGLPGDLDRVGAGDREVDARRIDRREGAEAGGERDPRRVRGDVAEAVQRARPPGGRPRRRRADGGGRSRRRRSRR